MLPRKPLLLSFSVLLALPLFVLGDPSKYSEECVKANKECEEDTDCTHRLGYLQATCNTNTCQPQCRKAVLNLFQNRKGKALLRTDTSCLTGRSELEKCNFLPNRHPLHCDLTKLACEMSLPCNTKWQVFQSECESEAAKGQCSDKCRSLLQATFATEQGAAFKACTCTDKEDQLCEQLRNTTQTTCSGEVSPAHRINHSPEMNENQNQAEQPAVKVITDTVETTTKPSSAGTFAISFFLLFATLLVW